MFLAPSFLTIFLIWEFCYNIVHNINDVYKSYRTYKHVVIYGGNNTG